MPKKAVEKNGKDDVMKYIKAQKDLVNLHDDHIKDIKSSLKTIESKLNKALGRLGIS